MRGHDGAADVGRAGRGGAGAGGGFGGWRAAAAVATGAAAAVSLAAQVRVARPEAPASQRWQHMPVVPRGDMRLGLSFRPRQAEAFGLDPDACLRDLLRHRFDILRVGAYWDRIEPGAGRFCPDELDRQIDAAEEAGKQLIVCLGAVKTFGYPEFFVPAHRLPVPPAEGSLVRPADHARLLAAAVGFLTRMVDRYRDRESVIAWQVEHDAVDPLGMEHSWRLSEAFVRAEVDAVRAADPSRPVLLNGFLPTSSPVAVTQWWRTRGQGDSLRVARRLADIVGVDFYPRHAVARVGGRSVYLAGGHSPDSWWRRRCLTARVAAAGQQLIVCEGQAEPWETDTVPPSPSGAVPFSCRPHDVIGNYNECRRWAGPAAGRPAAYLFWGAEYWLARRRDGDPRYLRAFARVLAES